MRKNTGCLFLFSLFQTRLTAMRYLGGGAVWKGLKLALLTSLLFSAGCSSTQPFIPKYRLSESTVPSDNKPTRATLGEESFWQGSPTLIWNRLQYIPPSQLMSSAETDPTRQGWIKLALMSKQYSKDTPQLIQQLNAFKTSYPHHPANALFSDPRRLETLKTLTPPRHIALLLPLKGSMGVNGQAVREGFLSAYYASFAKSHFKQTLSFYDTSQSPIHALYQQAVQQGATLVVGPLIKEDVRNLMQVNSLSVPTLALNYTEGPLPKNAYEFGLSPQGEAHQVADRIWAAGHSRVIVIAAQSLAFDRLRQNFIERFQADGGRVVETLRYSGETDFNTAIPILLGVNVREDQLRSRAGKSRAQLEKQRRQDFDVIFLLADTETARKIVPLLKYYYAKNIPIYATSSIYSGSLHSNRDKELNGVIFSEIPWMMKSGHQNRLNAVGHDAYAISRELPRLMQLQHFSLYGATGALTITPARRIYHRLPLATMRDGHP